MTTLLAYLILYVFLCGISTAGLLAFSPDLRDNLFTNEDPKLATVLIFLITPLVALAFVIEWAFSGLDKDFRS